MTKFEDCSVLNWDILIFCSSSSFKLPPSSPPCTAPSFQWSKVKWFIFSLASKLNVYFDKSNPSNECSILIDEDKQRLLLKFENIACTIRLANSFRVEFFSASQYVWHRKLQTNLFRTVRCTHELRHIIQNTFLPLVGGRNIPNNNNL